MKLLFVGAALCALVGCTSTSGVMRAGPDSFTLRATASPGSGGGAKAKQNAYAEANAECNKQGKTISVTNEKTTDPTFNDAMHSVDITFRCV